MVLPETEATPSDQEATETDGTVKTILYRNLLDEVEAASEELKNAVSPQAGSDQPTTT